jgi:hypothetical protein
MKKSVDMTKYILSLIFMLAVFIIPSVSANMITPGVGSNQSANFATSWNFNNITVTDGVTNPLVANTTFYWNASGSFVAVTATGVSFNNTVVSATLTISSMAEGAGSLRLIVGNQTALNNTMVDSGRLKLDKTNPTVTISFSKSQIQTQDTTILTCSNSDSGTDVKNVTIALISPDTTNCPTLNYTTCTSGITFTGSQTNCVGDYNAYITVTDYSGLSTSISALLNVNIRGAGVYIPQEVITNPEKAKTNLYWTIGIIFGILILLVFAFLILWSMGAFKGK